MSNGTALPINSGGPPPAAQVPLKKRTFLSMVKLDSSKIEPPLTDFQKTKLNEWFSGSINSAGMTNDEIDEFVAWGKTHQRPTPEEYVAFYNSSKYATRTEKTIAYALPPKGESGGTPASDLSPNEQIVKGIIKDKDAFVAFQAKYRALTDGQKQVFGKFLGSKGELNAEIIGKALELVKTLEGDKLQLANNWLNRFNGAYSADVQLRVLEGIANGTITSMDDAFAEANK